MPNKSQIIIYDHYEISPDGKYPLIKDAIGQTHSIAEKRSTLWKLIQDAQPKAPILLIYATYKDTDYISSVRLIKDELLNNAIRSIVDKVHDPINEERNRSQAIAYAKDLCCAGKVEFSELTTTANIVYHFIKGDTVNDNSLA